MTEGKLRDLLGKVGVKVIHKNSNNWLVCQCPFAEWKHENGRDTNPSFTIKINDKGYSGYNCFTCGSKGTLTTLLLELGELRGEDYRELARRAFLAETPDQFDDYDAKDYDEAFEPMEDSQSFIYLQMYPLAWEDEVSRNYLLGRGITEQTSHTLDLRYDPESKRVIFPVYDFENKLYGFTGRTTLSNDYMRLNKKYPKVKDYAGLRKEKCILGEHLISEDDEKPIIVVEGLFALAHFVNLGVREFADVVAVMGSSLSDTQAEMLVSYSRPIILCFDDDKAGNEGLFGLLDVIKSKELGEDIYKGGGAIDKLKSETKTYVAYFPEGIEDPDDLTLEDVRDIALSNSKEFCR